MAFILASLLKTYKKNELGEKVPIALKNDNQILDNIKRFVPKFDKFVFVANEPSMIEEHVLKLDIFKNSFDLTGIGFKENIVLNNSNKDKAKEILKDADLIILGGGKIICQKDFFEEIGLKEILSGYNGLVIGVSAGAMNLCDKVANFPEENNDIPEPRWTEGLGIFNKYIIPHFDGESGYYQFNGEDFDVAKEYILPMSKGKSFLAIDNDSYIIIDDNNNVEYYGNVYEINDGKIQKFKEELYEK